jgi:hypothetical protein
MSVQTYLRVRRRQSEYFVPAHGIDSQDRFSDVGIPVGRYGGIDNSDRQTEPLALPCRLSIPGRLPIAEAMPLSAPGFLVVAEGAQGLMA